MGSFSSSCSTKSCQNESELACVKCGEKMCYSCSTFHLLTEKDHFLRFLSIPDPFLCDVLLLKLRYSTSNHLTNLFIASKSKKILAVKVQDCLSLEELNKKQEEASLMRSLHHPSICKCYKSLIIKSKSGFQLLIFMEFCTSDMEEEIMKRQSTENPFTDLELQRNFSELVEALAYLQKINLAHRDIKPANLLIQGSRVKIADFGLSLQPIDLLRTSNFKCVGTLAYLSPALKKNYLENIKSSSFVQAVYNPFKSDVFSLGLTFLHMASLETPELNDGDNLDSRIEDAILRLKYSPLIKDLLRKMLVVNEKKRMDFLELSKYMNSTEISEVMTQKHSESLIKIAPSLSTSSLKLSELMISKSPSETLIHYTTNSTLPSNTETSPIKERSNSTQMMILPEICGKSAKFSNHSPLIPFKCKLISQYLTKNRDFEELDLEDCHLDHMGLGYLLESCRLNSALQVLNLGQNELGPEGGRTLGKAFSGLAELKVLKAFSCHLLDEGVMWISRGLAGLKEVYLADNGITSAGCCFISKNLGRIEILSLTHNSIEDEGATELAKGLLDSSVKSLFLNYNKIGNQAAAEIAKKLPENCLTCRLTGNYVSEDIYSLLRGVKIKTKLIF